MNKKKRKHSDDWHRFVRAHLRLRRQTCKRCNSNNKLRMKHKPMKRARHFRAFSAKLRRARV